MSKSVLVIDTPKKCDSCIYVGTFCSFCRINCRDIKDTSTKPDWCPLMDLPEKDDFDDLYDEYYTGYHDGWNRCLEERINNGESNIGN